jgi:prepilin-type N-terminal cleavage/methylation domain-containing protein/prepilin-type processing-associated H-X9-DG protein
MSLLKRRAFTLAELIVVIAIIVLLVAILMPSYTGAVTAQRRVECGMHLEQIGQACAARIVNLGAGITGQVAASGWQNSLRTFVSNDKTVFICPEDGNPAPDAGGGLKGICIEVFYGGSYLWDVYLDQAGSTQWIWKMSSTQFNEFMKVSGEGKTTPYKAVYMKTGYVEDSDPYTMYFTFEDTAPNGGGDQDFYDVILKTHYTDSEIQFEVVVRASGMSFALCNKDPDRKVLIPNLSLGAKISVPYYGGKTSYGINSMSGKILPARRKLLVLDYERPVAVGSAFDEGTDRATHLGYWYPNPQNPKAPPPFARHYGKINTLFADGSVRLMSPDAINPNYPENVREYWNP